MLQKKNKVVTFTSLLRLSQQLKRNGKKIVLCVGVFDLLHPGHIRHLKTAKSYGDVLIVALIADRFVKNGPGRPIFNQTLRGEVLSALESVDFVTIIEASDAIYAITKIKPHFLVKGADHKVSKTSLEQKKTLELEINLLRKIGGELKFTDDPLIFSSSHLINQYLEPYPEKTQEYLKKLREKYSTEQIISHLKSLQNKRIMVIGDAIIDEYHYTDPLGKSSKEPVLVHKFREQESFAGGTLATANHLAAFSKQVSLMTLLGKRQSYERFIHKSLRQQITPIFFHTTSADTVVDRRYIDETTHQKLFQIAYMRNESMLPKTEAKMLKFLKKELGNFDLVVVNDFGRGMITPKMIRILCKKSTFLALNVQANSSNYGFNIVTKYPRADFVCLDENELRLAAHDKHSDLFKLIKRVAKKLHCKELIVTRGSSGSISYSPGNGVVESPALAQSVVDRVGAGDAFFAIASPCAYSGMDQTLVSFIGNVAGAIKVQSVGHRSPIDFDDMTAFITRLMK